MSLFPRFVASVDIGALAYANIVFGTNNGNENNRIITPGDYTSYVELYAHFMAIVNTESNLMTTETHLAIEKMREMFAEAVPPYQEKIGIVITDGKSSHPAQTEEVSIILILINVLKSI